MTEKDGGAVLTPKQQYEARKAERKKRIEAREYLSESQDESDQMIDMLDRFVTAIERIADHLTTRNLQPGVNNLGRVQQGRFQGALIEGLYATPLLTKPAGFFSTLTPAEAERAKIVAWLRHKAEMHSYHAAEFRDTDIDLAKSHKSVSHTSGLNADAIERGDHLTTGSEGSSS